MKRQIYTFSLFTVILTLSSMSYSVAQCVVPPSGMVGWWDADSVSGNTAFDIQGGNDGTLVNGASIVSGKVGK